MFIQGLEVTLWGLVGVFSVLLLFYIVVVLLGKLKNKEENEEA
jgi:Na+-transporting methylmalonyl-CoA/oxaloacetate decarboxylase gamma subunit